MFCNFSALARLPIVDATAISFVSPLITVAMSAAFLKERVRVYRWSAVTVGFIGILVMLGPHFDLSAHAGTAGTTLGLAFAIAGAFCNSGSVIQTRRLAETDRSSLGGINQLKDLLKKKQSGQKIEAPREREPSKVVNLMDRCDAA
jgi:drug/metabolite transporter (DMT)-like permease